MAYIQLIKIPSKLDYELNDIDKNSALFVTQFRIRIDILDYFNLNYGGMSFQDIYDCNGTIKDFKYFMNGWFRHNDNLKHKDKILNIIRLMESYNDNLIVRIEEEWR